MLYIMWMTMTYALHPSFPPLHIVRPRRVDVPGKGHCATSLDCNAPVLANTSGDSDYIVAMDIWSTVADVD